MGNHIDIDDDDRREVEGKLLRYYYQLLISLPNQLFSEDSKSTAPNPKKSSTLKKVTEISNGMCLLNLRDSLAWQIKLDFKDYTDFSSLSDLDLMDLRKYLELFDTRDGKTSGIRALLISIGDEKFLKSEEERKKDRDVDESLEKNDETVMDLVMDSLEEEKGKSSLLINRIGALVYLLDKDYGNARSLAENGMKIIETIEKEIGLKMESSRIEFMKTLGISLVNEGSSATSKQKKAINYLESTLSAEAYQDDLDTLISLASSLFSRKNYQESAKVYQKVLYLARKQDSNDPKVEKIKRISLFKNPAFEAEIQIGWIALKTGDLEESKSKFEELIDRIGAGEFDSSLSGEDKAKVWYRFGMASYQVQVTSTSSDPILAQESYTSFITSLKHHPLYAPSFTALGFYYLEIQSPKDELRSSKCFQKAFELSSTEFEAARMLAVGFGEEGEWDIVEVIARRVIEGEAGGGESTANPWAYKAIGNVEFNKGNYDDAIRSFQISIRCNEKDLGGWIRLGESYGESGRHLAGLKCFEWGLRIWEEEEHKRIESGKGEKDLGIQKWQILFSIANVKRQIGNLEEAILGFKEVLEIQRGELGIMISLAEVYEELARKELKAGYLERALNDHHNSLNLCLEILQMDLGLKSCWKILADGFFELSRFGEIKSEVGERVKEVGQKILDLIQKDGIEIDEKLPEINVIQRKDLEADLITEGEQVNLSALFLKISIYLCKFRVLLTVFDDSNDGSSWVDLSLSLHIFSQSPIIPSTLSSKSKSQSISSLKQALKASPANPAYWLLLGNLTFDFNSKLAQHSFIKSIEYWGKKLGNESWKGWNGLGFLYLKNHDWELGNMAFIKAQTLDPDQAEPWAGQALVAKQNGDEESSRKLFEHAVKLSEGSVVSELC